MDEETTRRVGVMPDRGFTLVPHPAHGRGPLAGLRCELRTRGRHLQLCYQLDGDTAALRLPEAVAPGVADGLWEHTCFELFVKSADGPAYVELNLSPSRAWAAYRFRDYRVADASAGGFSGGIDITCGVRARGLTLEAELPLAWLHGSGRRCQCGISAVIEDRHGRLYYWALAHPGARPDFHDAGAWLGEIEIVPSGKGTR